MQNQEDNRGFKRTESLRVQPYPSMESSDSSFPSSEQSDPEDPYPRQLSLPLPSRDVPLGPHRRESTTSGLSIPILSALMSESSGTINAAARLVIDIPRRPIRYVGKKTLKKAKRTKTIVIQHPTLERRPSSALAAPPSTPADPKLIVSEALIDKLCGLVKELPNGNWYRTVKKEILDTAEIMKQSPAWAETEASVSEYDVDPELESEPDTAVPAESSRTFSLSKTFSLMQELKDKVEALSIALGPKAVTDTQRND